MREKERERERDRKTKTDRKRESVDAVQKEAMRNPLEPGEQVAMTSGKSGSKEEIRGGERGEGGGGGGGGGRGGGEGGGRGMRRRMKKRRRRMGKRAGKVRFSGWLVSLFWVMNCFGKEEV